MQRLESEGAARVAELSAELEEVRRRCGVAEQQLVSKIRQYREQTKRAEGAEASLAETRSELATRTEELRARSGELAGAEKLIVYLKNELYGSNGKVAKLELELAEQTTRAETAEGSYAREQAARAAAEAVIADQTAQLTKLEKETIPGLRREISEQKAEIERLEGVLAATRAELADAVALGEQQVFTPMC